MIKRPKRITVNLVAELISNAGLSTGFIRKPEKANGIGFYAYAGIIADVSSEGMKLIVPADNDIRVQEDSQYDIGFQLPTGKRVNLHCEVKWQDYKKAFYGLSHCIGLEILSPPPEYRKYFESISNDQER